MRDLERKFSGTGLANACSRETVTGFHRRKTELEPNDREVRKSTEEPTAEASLQKGARCQVGKKKGGGKTTKSETNESLLPKLYDIGVGDENQPPSKLEFLIDQRNERKSYLPPIIGSSGSERRRKRRHEQELKRQERENKEQEE